MPGPLSMSPDEARTVVLRYMLAQQHMDPQEMEQQRQMVNGAPDDQVKNWAYQILVNEQGSTPQDTRQRRQFYGARPATLDALDQVDTQQRAAQQLQQAMPSVPAGPMPQVPLGGLPPERPLGGNLDLGGVGRFLGDVGSAIGSIPIPGTYDPETGRTTASPPTIGQAAGAIGQGAVAAGGALQSGVARGNEINAALLTGQDLPQNPVPPTPGAGTNSSPFIQSAADTFATSGAATPSATGAVPADLMAKYGWDPTQPLTQQAADAIIAKLLADPNHDYRDLQTLSAYFDSALGRQATASNEAANRVATAANEAANRASQEKIAADTNERLKQNVIMQERSALQQKMSQLQFDTGSQIAQRLLDAQHYAAQAALAAVPRGMEYVPGHEPGNPLGYPVMRTADLPVVNYSPQNIGIPQFLDQSNQAQSALAAQLAGLGR